MSEAKLRRPLQGVRNIVRFNWPYYVAAAVVVIVAIVISRWLQAPLNVIMLSLAGITLLGIFVSLAVSLYVYDLSGFYDLHWLDDRQSRAILTLNAGFDEITSLVAEKFPNALITVCDFYDPRRNTAPSIRRARKAYPLSPHAIQIAGARLPFGKGSFDLILAIMSAHEFRDEASRTELLSEMHRCVTNDGEIVIVEHMRDAANLLAYNIGAMHFHTLASWRRSICDARLLVADERKVNRWVTAFSLISNGTID